MESDVSSSVSSRLVLKTVARMPSTFINQLFAVNLSVISWVSLGSISYCTWAIYLYKQQDERAGSIREPGSLSAEDGIVEWTYVVQTAAFGAVLLLNILNLGMRQHLLPFKCNLLLLFINGVAFVTDLLLCRGASPVALSSTGRAFAPLRYVQWCHSTPTMIYMMALLADAGGWPLALTLGCDVAMVLTGLGACYTSGLLKAALMLLSFATFAVVLWFVYGLFQKTIAGDVSAQQRSTLRTVLALLLALWSAFPAVWLAADQHLISPAAEAIAWGVCDYLAKVVFSSQLWQSNLSGVQLRRDRALEAWEASNRVEAVARLTALLRQRDDLLSTLSHELRTPLAGIVALTGSLCKDASACPPGAARTLGTVRAAATCMLNIVTATLDSFAGRRTAPGAECLLPGPADGGAAPSGTAAAAGTGTGPAAVALTEVDLRPLIETVTSVLRPLAHDGVAVVTDLPEGLPLVCADATRLSQVLYNLVGNAMRFTSHGEVRVSARILVPEGASAPAAAPAASVCSSDPGGAAARCASGASASGSGRVSSGGSGGLWRRRTRRPSSSSMSSSASSSAASVQLPPGSEVEVCVEDTGVGMPQETLGELFQPYRTGDKACGGHESADGAGASAGASRSRPRKERRSTPMGGTGLGLYLVRLALRSQGSDITAESVQGLGSTFRFRLPAAPQQRRHHQQEPQQGERAAAGADPAPAQRPPQQTADRAPAPAVGAASGDAATAAQAGGAVAAPALTAQPSAPNAVLRSVAANARLKALSAAWAVGSGRPASAAARPLVTESPRSEPASLLLQKQRLSLDEQRQRQGSLLRQMADSSSRGIAAGGGPAAASTAAAEPMSLLFRAPPGVAAAAIPAAAAASAAKKTARELPMRLLGSNFRHHNNGTLQVMSVDDDAINQLVAGQMLTSQSWKVVKCMNGPDALKHLHLPADADGDAAGGAGAGGTVSGGEDLRGGLAAAVAAATATAPIVLPDCILLDVMMPGMSGFEVCRRLRQRYANAQLPVIIVSAKGDAAAVEEAFAAGADDYISKPYKRAEMVARIRAQIRIRDGLNDIAAATAAEVEAEPAPERSESGAVALAQTEAQSAVSVAPMCVTAGMRGRHGPSAAVAPDPSTAPAAVSTAPAGSSGSLYMCSPRLVMRPLAGPMETVARVASGWPTPFTLDPRNGTTSQPSLYMCCSSVGNRDAAAASARAWQMLTDASTGPATAPMSPLLSPLVVRVGPESAAGNAAEVAAAAGEPRQVTVADVGVGTSAPLPLLTPQASAATVDTLAATAAATSDAVAAHAPAFEVATGGNGRGADGSPPAVLLREVLEEVRRSQRLESDLAKLNTRVAALQATCGSLAADRDGWRRQARELRALLAAGLGRGGGGGGHRASSDGRGAGNGSGGGLYEKLLSSGPPAVNGACKAQAGSDGSSASSLANGVVEAGGETVEAQLKDLKREAALMRQQLTLALASVGTGASWNADSAALCGGGSSCLGTAGLGLGLGAGSSRIAAGSLPAPVAATAGSGAGGAAATLGDTDVGGAGAGAAQAQAEAAQPRIAAAGSGHGMAGHLLMATNVSDMSAPSGGGGGASCLVSGTAEACGGCNGNGNVASCAPDEATAQTRSRASTVVAPIRASQPTTRARPAAEPTVPHRAASGSDAGAPPAAQVGLGTHLATSISSDAHTRVDGPVHAAAVAQAGQGQGRSGAEPPSNVNANGGDAATGLSGGRAFPWRARSGEHESQEQLVLAPGAPAGSPPARTGPRSGGAGGASARILRRLCNGGVTSNPPDAASVSSGTPRRR